LAGVTPLCTTGTYELVATLRATLPNCDGSAARIPCTIPDRTVTFDIAADGTELDFASGFAFAGLAGALTAQVIEPRIYDPTGARFVASAAPGTVSLRAPYAIFNRDRRRIRALFPPTGSDLLDATAGNGVSFVVTDRDGTLFSGHIPASRWQLQPPLGERFEYKDPGGVIAGIRKARLKLLRKKGVAVGYDVRLDAQGLAPAGPVIGVDLTVTAPLPLADDTILDLSGERNRICTMRGAKVRCE